MWCFVFGCVSLLYVQNTKAQGVYEFPGRFNQHRRTYEVYPSNPAYGAVYPSHFGNRRFHHTGRHGVVYSTYSASRGGYQGGVATGGGYQGGVPSGGVYPNYGVRRVMYPTNAVGYPNSVSSGVESFNAANGVYPSNAAVGAVYPNNVASGANYPVNGAVSTPYQTNSGTGLGYTNNASGVDYSHQEAIGTPYQTSSGTGVGYPNNTVGSVSPNTNGVAGTDPNSGNRTVGPASPSTNTLGGTSPNSDTEIVGPASPSANNLAETSPNQSGGTRVFTPASVQQQKVHLDVYYETNCPDSKRFITDQLTPVYRDFKDILEVRLIPFGKGQAFFDANSKKYQFQCHHGPAECYGNTIQGCSISLYPDIETHLNFIDCMESYPRPSDNGQKCARRLSLDWKSISKCADGEEGQRILYRNAEITKALQPSLYFVPWININKVHTNEIQRTSLRDLKSVVCKAHKAPHPKC